MIERAAQDNLRNRKSTSLELLATWLLPWVLPARWFIYQRPSWLVLLSLALLGLKINPLFSTALLRVVRAVLPEYGRFNFPGSLVGGSARARLLLLQRGREATTENSDSRGSCHDS